MNRAELDKIKAASPLEEIGTELGLKFTRSHFATCPFHTEKTPSFRAYDDHFYCFGCTASGDVFVLSQHVLGLSFSDAATWLSRHANLPTRGTGRGESKLRRAARLHAKREQDRYETWLSTEWDNLLAGCRGPFQMIAFWRSCLDDAKRFRGADQKRLRDEICAGIARCQAAQDRADYRLDFWGELTDDQRRDVYAGREASI